MALESAPGVLGEMATTATIACACRSFLKDAALQPVQNAAVRHVISARLLPPKSSPRNAKMRRIQENESVFLLNIGYDDVPLILKTPVKHMAVWLIPHSTLTSTLQQQSANIFECGSLHIITGHSPDARRVRVSPLVTNIVLNPSDASARGFRDIRVCARSDSSDGIVDSWYICVFLQDLHQYVHLYHAFKRVHEESQHKVSEINVVDILAQNLNENVDSTLPQAPMLRAWMGYSLEIPTSALMAAAEDNKLIHIFGAGAQRDFMITYCLIKLQETKGDDFRFTDEQLDMLRQLHGPLVLSHCCAGSGKTTLLLCLCLWVLYLHSQERRVFHSLHV